jgi:carboxymethylenebutenolidase
MDRRAFVGGIALAAVTGAAMSARADDAGKNGLDDQVVWSRYAAKRDGRRPSVILLHGTRGFELVRI